MHPTKPLATILCLHPLSSLVTQAIAWHFEREISHLTFSKAKSGSASLQQDPSSLASISPGPPAGAPPSPAYPATKMSHQMSNKKLQKIMTQPINLIFRFFTNKSRVQLWLYEQPDLRIEGRIMVSLDLAQMACGGFDEYMNMVLDDAEEIQLKKNTRVFVGRILLKGENISLIMSTGSTSE
ncbi:small nuclear ribonucleoprotein [Cyclospora cayetanensis]|uniref:Small nuclear ribonucleoprotein E n=1 Tax=Cyclospora cayetanensis TaxID=88456 RepID=A0A1D3D9I5_9EIME|nr:small nuclear ribonucleoprotein [Cyclospora cayetanensis]